MPSPTSTVGSLFAKAHSDCCSVIPPYRCEHLFMCLKKPPTHSALNCPLATGFLKVCPVLNCFSITYPRTFVKGRRPLQAIRPCDFGVPLAVLCSVASDSATPWTVALQAPLSMGFPRTEYWSGLPFPSLECLSHPGIKPKSLVSPALAGRFFTTKPPGKPSQLLGCDYFLSDRAHAHHQKGHLCSGKN